MPRCWHRHASVVACPTRSLSSCSPGLLWIAVTKARGDGGRLLVDALRRCVRGGQEFGARAVVVDAIDAAAAQFYRHFGFRDLAGGRLWRKLSDIRAALVD